MDAVAAAATVDVPRPARPAPSPAHRPLDASRAPYASPRRPSKDARPSKGPRAGVGALKHPSAPRPSAAGPTPTPAPQTPAMTPAATATPVTLAPAPTTAAAPEAAPAATAPTTRATPVFARPIVPVTERRSHEDRGASRGTRDAELDRDEIVPDGSSAGREGRQFAVANVGNNGRIYLRPTVRPAHQRYPQPTFVFPVTPPGTGGLEQSAQAGARGDAPAGKRAAPPLELAALSQWTPTPSASPLVPEKQGLAAARSPVWPARHRRAMSDSTIRDLSTVADSDRNAYKVVIARPAADEKRPRTMDDANAAARPLLEISIPSWRIGTPRFTLGGTPVFRGSSYAPTDEVRSSAAASASGQSPMVPAGLRPAPAPRTLASFASRSPPPPPLRLSSQPRASPTPSPRPPPPPRTAYMPPQLVIEPAMFTELTLKPGCDDRSVVRFSPSGAVAAASPPRLVVEITSPSFLDYELISDFFLTYRAFIEPSDLLRMLVARLRWALARQDECGMVVRVRTFVAIRHWILNYFVDDFAFEHALRVMFCDLLNDFVDELSQDPSARKVQLKILAELKKCWRRVCAQYWDGPAFDDSLGPNVPIAPGGVPGNRDASLDPGFWAREGIAPPLPHALGPLLRASVVDSPSLLYLGAPRPAPAGDFVVVGHRPGTPEDRLVDGVDADDAAASPISAASADVLSCSLPTRGARGIRGARGARGLAFNAGQTAHPVPSTSANSGGPGPAQVATTPKALAGKRVRPTQAHRRNNSFSDSLREHAGGSDRSLSHDQVPATLLPSAGSLVRGIYLPPGQAFVDYEPHGPARGGNRQTTIFEPKGPDTSKDRAVGGAMSGHGMRKLLGSVRRVIRTRAPGAAPTQANLMTIAPAGQYGATTNRLPGTPIVPQGPPRQNGARPPVRIDLLGAEVAEDFKKAVREEEEAAAAERQRLAAPPPNSAPPFGGHPEYSVAHMDSSTFDSLPQNQRPRPLSDTGITVGSKSIVIVDGTAPFDVARPPGQYPPTANHSVETFTDTFMASAADPTPPNTPPAGSVRGNTPRRSSFLLHRQHEARAPAALGDALPPFIPDLDTLEGGRSAAPSEDAHRPSLFGARRLMRRPPLSGGTFRMHRRNPSAATARSLDSVAHGGRSSVASSARPPPTVRSFDATTDSGASGSYAEVAMPEPLRVLRRRPGGNLRAASLARDLDRMSLRRSRSVGSLATYTESIPSSYLLNTRPSSAGSLEPVPAPSPSPPPPPSPTYGQRGRDDVFSVGRLADRPPRRELSLFSTHSSRPMMRPSFEEEAQKLAQIPDEDDGGIESALAKLEGKYDRRLAKRSAVTRSLSPFWKSADADAEPERQGWDAHVLQERREERRPHLTDEPSAQHPVAGGRENPPAASPRRADDVCSFLSEDSHESYYSIPLLERGLADDYDGGDGTAAWTDRSILRGSDDEDSPIELERDARHSSFDFVLKTDSIERIQPGETAPPPEAEADSFLDDDSAIGTELSTEISTDVADSGDGYGGAGAARTARAPTPDVSRGPSVGRPMLSPVLAAAPPGCLEGQAPGPQPCATKKPLPPTPELTPVVPQCCGGLSPPCPPAAPDAGRPRKYSVHLPFILAFDSDVLAQQFTLIEKDALNEIDWKELIDMGWKNAAKTDSRSWVHFLRNNDAQGVEVVIARFNIMVKWAVSEIVLTQHIEERARCIIKLIHVASHCRRYRNFATLAQLTLALSGSEVTRLTETWKLVPPADVKTLKSLEALVTPMRNFHALRAEMEMGSDAGCIPFVGIYTHDLLYNAQRPADLVASPDAPPLVNFERCRIAAAVVKTFLRLLEASTRYTFVPVEGVTERCLWVGALSDEEIRRHLDSLE